MFGATVPCTSGLNILPLIWTYMVKNDGTKKAQCVCDRSPHNKGSVTINYTYAAALDQAGARTFWALAALNNHIVVGADATNAFGEAPPPKVPFYVTIDELFRDWWVHVLKRPPITPGHVLRVRYTLQCHPESLCL